MASGAGSAQLTGPEEKSGPGLIVWIGAMIGLTLVAAGIGGFIGLHLVKTLKQSLSPDKVEIAAPAPKPPGEAEIKELPPLIANLTDPPDTWVRVQAAISFDGKAVPKSDVLVAQIAEDLLGFLKTLSMSQIGGASGLQHLREDLNERVQIRSEGKVRELFIETLVVQ